MKILAYHGTDKCDFSRFDMKRVEPFNIGLHFGTKAAALTRINYLRKERPTAAFRLLACELTLNNPLRINDFFGNLQMLLYVLQDEISRSNIRLSPQDVAGLQQTIDFVSDRLMRVENDPRCPDYPILRDVTERKANDRIRSLFQSLGYDGLVYQQDLKDGKPQEDSYCVFDAKQVKIIGAEPIAVD